MRSGFIDRTLPITTKSVGDYGLTMLVDFDKEGDLDFVLGGRLIYAPFESNPVP